MDLTVSPVERKANQAHQMVDNAARQATDKAAPAIDRVAQVAHSTVDKVAGAAGPAAEWVGETAAELKQQRDALLDSCRVVVRERPLVVLGVALAAGYLLGRLSR